MITPAIYDWPSGIVPAGMLFHAGGQATGGGLTVAGVLVQNPEPGGRAALDMAFNYVKLGYQRRLASWLMSKASNGSVFRVRLANSLQLVPLADLGLSLPNDYQTIGVPWDGDLYWDSDLGWQYDVGALATAVALEGTSTLVIDMSAYALGLYEGHVIGHQDRAYMVDAIDYAGSIATITVSPPLRVEVAIGDYITFRPRMMGTVQDPAGLRSLVDSADNLRLGSITVIEALI